MRIYLGLRRHVVNSVFFCSSTIVAEKHVVNIVLLSVPPMS